MREVDFMAQLLALEEPLESRSAFPCPQGETPRRDSGASPWSKLCLCAMRSSAAGIRSSSFAGMEASRSWRVPDVDPCTRAAGDLPRAWHSAGSGTLGLGRGQVHSSLREACDRYPFGGGCSRGVALAEFELVRNLAPHGTGRDA